MARQRSIFICQKCAYESPRWVGQCPSCSSWNSFEETVVQKKVGVHAKKSSKSYSSPVILSSIPTEKSVRISSGIGEFDRVLGGGFVLGQVVLLAGEPGIGKSTLITQIARSMPNKRILYICGEESVGQIKLRADRLGFDADNLLMFSEVDIASIVSVIEQEKELSLIVVDSIQTLSTNDLTGIAGSVGQVKSCAQVLTSVAKKVNVPLIMVGHVTKEGTVAGPKVLEHIVDTVLYLEGDSQHLFRVLKTAKNRFGPVSEVGIFAMEGSGMQEVKNPSQVFLSSSNTQSSGACTTVVMEGFRPILFEVQALTTRTHFGYPKRTASGFNVNRLQVLLAILEKRCGLDFSTQDVYLSITGGLKVTEYACDLAVCLAIVSSFKGKPVGNVAAFGECGLSGEVRSVPHQKKRIQEARRMGFSDIISSSSVKSVKQAINLVFNNGKKE